MKSHRIRREPCVILPPNQRRAVEEHVIHGTERRARRNAALTASLGYRYHVHETEVLTVWGWLRKLACRST